MSKRRSNAQAAMGRQSRKAFKGQRLRDPRSLTDNVRDAAAWVIERTLDSRSPSSAFLDSALRRVEEPDQPLLRELTLGTLRWLRRIDHVISLASHRSMENIDPALRAPLRVGAYQLLFLDRVPAHAAVHEAVEHARRRTHKGGASFTNAVLRRIAREKSLDAWRVEERDPVRRMAVENSHPDLLVRRWVDQLGEAAARRMLAANNRPKPLQLLAFCDRGGRELLAESLIDEGLDVEPSVLAPQGLIVRRGNPIRTAAYRRGDFYIQDEASQAAALIPHPRVGERVLDAAAAPGGKGLTLLAAQPELEMTFADISPVRLQLLRSNLRRLGRPSLPIVVADGGRPPFRGSFDRVVVDLPCTGTGTLRKHPELKWRISEPEIGRLSRQSLRILGGAASRLAPGGLLVAITCSIEPEENERVIARFLEKHDELQPEPLEEHLDRPLRAGIRGPGFWRMLTAGDHDGFTVHALRRLGPRPA
ncbi:MAG: transcription antitermination factor NusB [Acidobacteriota bacterium]